MHKATDENITAIFWGLARGLTHSAIGEQLGIHRQTVKKIVDSDVYKTFVAEMETFFSRDPMDSMRQKKNTIVLKALMMSHMTREDVLKTAQSLAYDYHTSAGTPIHIEMEDINNFCEDFGIIF